MDNGDTQQISWKIEPSPDTAVTESSISDKSASWPYEQLFVGIQSAMRPFLSQARDTIEYGYPEQDIKLVQSHDIDTKAHYDHTTRIPQDSPEIEVESPPVHSLERDSLERETFENMVENTNPRSEIKPRVSFEKASTLVSDTPHLEPKRRTHSPNHEVGLSQVNSGQGQAATNVKWEEIRQLRIDVWSSRSQIHQFRATLRQKQQIKSSADDNLLGRMRMQILGVPFSNSGLPLNGQKTFEQLLQESQEARDIYGPLEDECNMLEDHLSSQEFELSQLEEAFYSHKSTDPQICKIKLGNDSIDLEVNARPAASNREEDIFEDVTDIQYHPLVSQYLSKLGDLDLLHERLDDLVEEKQALEAERQSRLRFGLTLDLDDQNWLDGSQHEYEALLNETKSLQRETEDLKRACLARGLVDEDGEPTTFQVQEEGSFKGEEEVHPGNQRSEYIKYPLLLPHPGIDQEDMEIFNPQPDERSNITTNRINEWMLNRLRMSPLDVNLLASTFEGSFGKMNDEWQSSVLSLWYNDGTFNTTPGLQVHTGSLTTEAGPASGSAPIEPRLNLVYQDSRSHPISPESESSTDTEIDLLRVKPQISLREGPLFWNSD